jgi:hypothetical protein
MILTVLTVPDKKHLIQFFSSLKEYQDFLLYTLKPGEGLKIVDNKLIKFQHNVKLQPEKDV